MWVQRAGSLSLISHTQCEYSGPVVYRWSHTLNVSTVGRSFIADLTHSMWVQWAGSLSLISHTQCEYSGPVVYLTHSMWVQWAGSLSLITHTQCEYSGLVVYRWSHTLNVSTVGWSFIADLVAAEVCGVITFLKCCQFEINFRLGYFFF